MSTYTPIVSQTLSASASSVTFNNIPQNYTDLILVTRSTTSVGGRDYNLRFNNDSSSLYSSTIMVGSGATATSTRFSNLGNTALYTVSGTSTTNPGLVITHLMNYSNSTTYKTIIQRGNEPAGEVTSGISLYRSTNPITRIDIYASTGSGNWNSGSTFSLYGIEASTPKAQGGNIVTTDGTYWYHAFKASGTFTPNQALTADYLIVAGGGGAMGNISGGGGAGGVRAFTSQSFNANTVYSVVVGAGGTGGGAIYFAPDATEGGNTTFKGTSVTGGGHGQYGAGVAGNGGSGGGIRASGTYGTGNAGGYSPVEGYNGSGNTNAVHGGGGGGAGAAGGNGPGGAGTQTYNSINFSTWLTATSTGSSSYVAGGGGGTQAFSTGTYSGGIGGGGTGAADNTDGGNGVTNTGSGGGGGGYYNGVRPGIGGAGGSGLVIVRYTV
jgi:hypothetical protein